MTAGERLRGWIDDTAVAFAERLGGWVATSVKRGMETSMDFLEPELRDEVKPSLLRIRDIPGVPDDLKSMLDKTVEEPKAIHLLAILPFLAGILIGFGMQMAAPIARVGSYMMDKLVKSARIDPMSVITAWRRDPEKYAGLFEDLKDQGWSDERIEALKFFTLFMPTATDIVHWYAREVYEPDMVDRYSLDDELPAYEGTDFPKVGVDSTQARNYWMAHWEHASYMQIREMLRRGLLSLDKAMPTPPTTKEGWAARDAEGIKAAYDWYRLVEISTFWRARLTEMMWEVPTRVDVRRFWDMRTISEEELYSIYHRHGYHGKDLDNYVLWTKVYVAFPDLMARWKNGWITLDEVKSTLTGLGMPAARVDEFIETKVKATEPERTVKDREITITDVYRGVRLEVITREEGIELLQDLGFDEVEADYKLTVNVPEDEVESVVKDRELTKADILKGLKLEVITREEARDRLLGKRYKLADVELLLKIFDAQVKPPVEPREREASKADIILAVKKGLITPEDAYLMLQDIDFTPEAAAFILEVKAEVSPFSPINFAEFKDLTQKYRVAAGMEAKPMPEEIKQAAAEVVTLTGEVEALELSITEEKRGLIEAEPIPEAAAKRLKSLQVKRNRAIATLEKAKSEYDRLVAEWRH